MHSAVRHPVVGVLIVHVMSCLVVGGVGTHRHRCMRHIAVVTVACVALHLGVVARIASCHCRHCRLWWQYDQVRGRRHETGARERVGHTAQPGKGMARGRVHNGRCQQARRHETAQPTGRGTARDGCTRAGGPDSKTVMARYALQRPNRLSRFPFLPYLIRLTYDSHAVSMLLFSFHIMPHALLTFFISMQSMAMSYFFPSILPPPCGCLMLYFVSIPWPCLMHTSTSCY